MSTASRIGLVRWKPGDKGDGMQKVDMMGSLRPFHADLMRYDRGLIRFLVEPLGCSNDALHNGCHKSLKIHLFGHEERKVQGQNSRNGGVPQAQS